MKILKYILPLFLLTLIFFGCSKDDDDKIPPIQNPMEGFHKVHEMISLDYMIEIYSEKPRLEVGYNNISIRIKDLTSGNYLNQAAPTWQPIMDMGDMEHGAPFSALSPMDDGTVYNGHIVFTMAGDHHHGWELMINFTVDGHTVGLVDHISVNETVNGLVNTQVFTGTDGIDYVLAYMEPQLPEVAINDMEAILYQMEEDMMTFNIVENYTVDIDPRMPSMGNHSSPNSVSLTYNSSTKTYMGKLSLSMTGYWKINMQLKDASGEVVKGEAVTEDHPTSSLYFEIEF